MADIALVLGSGAARGWAHIGVVHALAEEGIEPDLICGTSIGALVGAAVAAGKLKEIEEWISGLDQVEVLSLLDRGFSMGGFIHGAKLMSAFESRLGDPDIEDLPVKFAAVATDIENGREVWLKSGSIISAVRASIAIPGMFAPVCVGDRWLVDGGLVNPVPVSVTRALGAGNVIAVNLNGDLVGNPAGNRRYARPGDKAEDDSSMIDRMRSWWSMRRRWPALGKAMFAGSSSSRPERPGILSVMADSIDIMQDRITRARLAGEPPDVLLSPKLGHLGILEFDRSDEAIEAGYKCAKASMDEILRLTSRAPGPARN